MQAIVTKYLGPTNYKGGRIKAVCERGSVTIPYPYEANQGRDAHMVAVRALLDKFDTEDKAKYDGKGVSWGRMDWRYGELPRAAKFHGVAVCG